MIGAEFSPLLSERLTHEAKGSTRTHCTKESSLNLAGKVTFFKFWHLIEYFLFTCFVIFVPYKHDNTEKKLKDQKSINIYHLGKTLDFTVENH